nr:ferrous iron transport protein A [Paenibacillus larvae]
MKLTENFVGKQVRITDVSSVSDLVKRRLVDFGIMEGTVIKLKNAALWRPFYDRIRRTVDCYPTQGSPEYTG